MLSDSVFWSSKDRLEWGNASQANEYNVYRGNLASLTASGYDHVCFRNSIGQNSSLIADTPAATQGWYFLVSGGNVCGEGGLGSDGAGAPRPNSSPCP